MRASKTHGAQELRRKIITRAGAIALVAYLVTAATSCTPVQSGGGTAGTSCTEDMPCWDCHTMGNHVCGPVSAKLHETKGTISFYDRDGKRLAGYVMETAEGVTLLAKVTGAQLAYVPWNRVEVPCWSTHPCEVQR